MKDAKGHGSDAHNTGIDQIGRVQDVAISRLTPMPENLAWIEKYSKQDRAAGRATRVEMYREKLRTGAHVDPIHVTKDTAPNGESIITDGHTRYLAFKAEGRKVIPAIISRRRLSE